MWCRVPYSRSRSISALLYSFFLNLSDQTQIQFRHFSEMMLKDVLLCFGSVFVLRDFFIRSTMPHIAYE